MFCDQWKCIGNIWETTLRGCYRDATAGVAFSTAGQRVDPSSESTFVCRVTSTDTYSDIVSVMSYTNWDRAQPKNAGDNETNIAL